MQLGKLNDQWAKIRICAKTFEKDYTSIRTLILHHLLLVQYLLICILVFYRDLVAEGPLPLVKDRKTSIQYVAGVFEITSFCLARISISVLNGINLSQ